VPANADRWAQGRAVVRAADPRMAVLVDERPLLDPDAFFDSWPSELWSALVAQVIGQQISLAAAGAIRGRLQALCGGRLPTPAQLLAFDEATLLEVGLSHAKAAYLHDLAARLVDGRLDLGRLETLDDDAARSELTQIKGVGRSRPTECCCSRSAGATSGPPRTWRCAERWHASGSSTTLRR
jgi:DNA-3-methyladenine glycosylase II